MSKANLLRPFSRVRAKESQNTAATYMQDRMEGDLSPSITEPRLQYSAEINKFVSPGKKQEILVQKDALFSDAKLELEQLRQAIVQYQQKTHPESRALVRLDTEACSWSEVKEVIKIAPDSEVSGDEESWNAKGFCRKIAKNITAFENWLGLLPSGDYGAVVCGVFKMIVGGVKRATEVRNTVLKALADIPDLVVRAHKYRELYNENQQPQELIQVTAELCSTILVALRYVMYYFMEGIAMRALKAVGQGENYKRSVMDQLERVKDLTIKIDQEAHLCAQYRLKRLEESLEKERQENRKRAEMMTEMLRRQEALPQEIMSQLGGYVVNNMLSFFESKSVIDIEMIKGTTTPQTQESPTSFSATEFEKTAQWLSKDDLLLVLASPHEVYYRDLERCLAKGRSLDEYDQDRVKWIMQSSKLRAWLNDSESRVLLINGNEEGNEAIYPPTFLSAKIIESLANIEPIITLYFFCSLHTTSSRPEIEDNAAGMVKGLIIQLMLRNFSWDLNFLSQEDLEKLEDNDLDTMCRLFGELIWQLPSNTLIFWMIDGITFYERSSKRKDFLKAINELLNLLEACVNVVIKFLLTCYGRSGYVAKSIDDKEDILLVPANVDGDCQGWSEPFWERNIGQDVDNLEELALGDNPCP